MNDPIVVAAFLSEREAHLARAVLEGDGIAAGVVVRDETLPRLCADAFESGFDVVVASADAERAIARLQRLWPEERHTVDVEQCPACGSGHVARVRRLVLFAIATVVLLAAGAFLHERDLFLLMIGITAALLLIAPNRRCRDCRERWRT